jgi:hypothetical protein
VSSRHAVTPGRSVSQIANAKCHRRGAKKEVKEAEEVEEAQENPLYRTIAFIATNACEASACRAEKTPAHRYKT